MEANKGHRAYNDVPMKILLPVSLGASSLALLHVLDLHLRRQRKKSGRTSYHLHVLFVDQSAFTFQSEYQDVWDNLKRRFSQHTYSVLKLDELSRHETLRCDELLPMGKASDEDNGLLQEAKLTNLLAKLPSATSRVDLLNIVRGRIIFAFAASQGCSSIVFGDSTTRLAERTLAETAKGRGGLMSDEVRHPTA